MTSYRQWPLKPCKFCGKLFRPQTNSKVAADRVQCCSHACGAQAKNPRRTPGSGRPLCSVDLCANVENVGTLCAAHYRRLKEWGDVRADLPIKRGKAIWESGGYRYLTRTGHPNAHKENGSIAEHRFVMSEMIGRPLLPNETVHHKNGNKKDNRPENLELWASNHPRGQRVADLVTWAKELLELYEPEVLELHDKLPAEYEVGEAA